MKTTLLRLVAALAVAAFLPACGSDSETAVDTAIATPAPDITPSATAAAGAAAPPATTAPAAPASETDPESNDSGATRSAAASGPVKITGRDFRSKEFDPPHLEAEGMQLLQHYGAVQAQVKLPRDTSSVQIAFTPRPVNGSNPVVGILLERTAGGPYMRQQVLQDEVLQSPQVITKQVLLEKGEYRVTVQYYKSSSADRTQLEIHSIVFE
jgi:hypothetical protein